MAIVLLNAKNIVVVVVVFCEGVFVEGRTKSLSVLSVSNDLLSLFVVIVYDFH